MVFCIRGNCLHREVPHAFVYGGIIHAGNGCLRRTRQLLRPEFSRGAVYEYFSVPLTVYEALLAAPSKGRYFNQAIRGGFWYRLLVSAGLKRQQFRRSCS